MTVQPFGPNLGRGGRNAALALDAGEQAPIGVKIFLCGDLLAPHDRDVRLAAARNTSLMPQIAKLRIKRPIRTPTTILPKTPFEASLMPDIMSKNPFRPAGACNVLHMRDAVHSRAMRRAQQAPLRENALSVATMARKGRTNPSTAARAAATLTWEYLELGQGELC